jgi:hypothetical protein
MIFLKSLILFLGSFLFLSSNAHASFLYASGALKAGYGTTSTTDTTTVQKTTMTAYAVDASVGVKYFGVILGANGEYALWKQLTDPSKVSNINSQGKLTAITPILGFELGAFRLIGKLPSLLSGDYTLDKANSSGQIVKYKSADALSLQLHWIATPVTFWGIEYQSLKFKKVDTAGTESALTDAQKLKMNSYSILYGIFF